VKTSKTCPKCTSRDIFYTESVPDRGYMDSPSDMGLGTRQSFWKGSSGGELEAYACKQCGYVEFYVRDLSTLE